MLTRVAFFVSDHGFGHAARSCAVMAALLSKNSNLELLVVTSVPDWFFRQSLGPNVSLSVFNQRTDIGLIQTTPTEEDLVATLSALEDFYPLRDTTVEDCVRVVRKFQPDLVVCDISVLGLVVAEIASVPSALIENFTWDWIYNSYATKSPKLTQYIDYLAPLFNKASVRISTEPVCGVRSSNLIVPPVARKIKIGPDRTRRQLGRSVGDILVLVTMGGVKPSFKFVSRCNESPEITFILAGFDTSTSVPANVITIPPHSDFHHPDLVAACDAIVGKVGYSTVAESYFGRTQFFFTPRPAFAESAVMESFVQLNLAGQSIDPGSFDDGDWIVEIQQKIVKLPPLSDERDRNGADIIGEYLNRLQ